MEIRRTGPMLRRGLRWEITIALVAKLVILAAIYFSFFATSSRPRQDATSIAATVLGAPVTDRLSMGPRQWTP